MVTAGSKVEAPLVRVTHDRFGAKTSEAEVRNLSEPTSQVRVERIATETQETPEDSPDSEHSPNLCTHSHSDTSTDPVAKFLGSKS